MEGVGTSLLRSEFIITITSLPRNGTNEKNYHYQYFLLIRPKPLLTESNSTVLAAVWRRFAPTETYRHSASLAHAHIFHFNQ